MLFCYNEDTHKAKASCVNPNVLAKEIIMALVIAGPVVRTVLGKDVDLNLYNHEETSPPEILTGAFDRRWMV